MSQVNVIKLNEFLFKYVRYYNQYPDKAIDADLSTLWGEIASFSVNDKADKVSGAVNGNFAGLDGDGNLTDSGKNASSFALAGHNHDTRYLRLNASNVYDLSLNGGQTFTWAVVDTAPFIIDNTSGDPLPVVTHLNADKLDDYDASAFALAGHTHAKYAEKAIAQTIVGPWTFNPASSGAPFLLGANALNQLVTGLNADKLDGNDSTAFAAAVHTHDDRYYTETEIDDAIDLLLAKPTTGTTDGLILVYNDPIVQTSPVNLSDLALATDLAGKYDEISAVTNNICVFDFSGASLKDSGIGFGDLVAVANMDDYSITAGFAQDSTIESGSYFIVGSNNSNGLGVTPGGTLEIRVNGSTYYVLTSATP